MSLFFPIGVIFEWGFSISILMLARLKNGLCFKVNASPRTETSASKYLLFVII
jgi:hypothetical protein